MVHHLLEKLEGINHKETAQKIDIKKEHIVTAIVRTKEGAVVIKGISTTLFFFERISLNDCSNGILSLFDGTLHYCCQKRNQYKEEKRIEEVFEGTR